MCKISFNELVHTDIDGATVSSFEDWFTASFGVRSVHAREVLCGYINVLEPHPGVVEHLLSLQEYQSLVFDPSMDQKGALCVDAMLFIPAATIVKSSVQAKGIYSNGDVLFRQSVHNDLNDIRIKGRMVAASMECRRAACIVEFLDIKLGNALCEGDLIVEHHLQVAGTLTALSHLKARTLQVKKAALMDGGLEVTDSVFIDNTFAHRGSLEISQTFAVGNLAG